MQAACKMITTRIRLGRRKLQQRSLMDMLPLSSLPSTPRKCSISRQIHSKASSITSHRLIPHLANSFCSTTSESGIKIDCVKVEITQTPSDQEPAESGGCLDKGEKGETNTGPKMKKNQQQKAEEELYMLQSHAKQHFNHANYIEALSTSEEILQKSIEVFGENHPATASAYNNIGIMNKMMGNFDVSRTNYHSALSIYEKIVGKDHASYAAALNNLGNLDRSQSMVDEDLGSLQRMQLNDSAIEYFQEAWEIRKAELGEEHVYTVSSRTNLGGAIAAQVLQGEILRQTKLREAREKENFSGEQEDVTATNENEIDSAWTVSKYTKEKWDAAEEHLRAAFRVAVKSPRGEKVAVAKTKEKTFVPKQRYKSRKERQKAARRRNRQKEEMAGRGNGRNSLGDGDISICTLSSAAAGQNLAVFLKSRADLLRSSQDASTSDYSFKSGDMYAEAKNLYLGALRVRNVLKGEYHPDTVATKFSLAELIDAVGDEAGANTLRQELLDLYQVEEQADDGMDADKKNN